MSQRTMLDLPLEGMTWQDRAAAVATALRRVQGVDECLASVS